MTAVAFAAVGGMKSRFVDQSWRRWALETVVAAALADATGAFLQSVV